MNCPTCKKTVNVPGPGEPMGSFPFCSDRCKLIDLGRWLDGKYQIPVAEEDDDSPPPEAPPDPRDAPQDGGSDPDSNGGARRRSRPFRPN